MPENEQDQNLSDFFGMILLAAVWGFTNPWMAKATREKKDEIKDNSQSRLWYLKPFLDVWRYLKNWRFVLPFLINQSASLFFLFFVIRSDLSKAVCTINSLTFVFTALFSRLVFNELIDVKRTFLGSLLIMAGIGVIHNKIDFSTFFKQLL